MTSPENRAGEPAELSVSIVTHNNATCLPAFLESLASQRGVCWKARFFDSGSTDATVRLLRESRCGDIEVSSANVGYSVAHNRNVAHSKSPFVLMLNADLEFGPDIFSLLVDHMKANPGQGIAGPNILEGGDVTPFPPRKFYPGEGMVALEPGFRRSEIAWINGCCMIARRDVLEALNGFDESFFLYQAETDLCLRARRAGYVLGNAPHVTVHHLHRQSQRSESDYEYALKLFSGSAVFWKKHYSPRDVRRMARFQCWISSALLNLAPIASRISPRPKALSAARLRARRDVCRELLDRGALDKSSRPQIPGRIVLRQSRLAFEFVRQGRFPLDDY